MAAGDLLSQLQISIHALREEGDGRSSPTESTGSNFYPRPPRGGRLDAGKATIMANLFLSTPSARRATSCQRGLCPPGGYFYPRPPRGGRPW